MKRKADSQSGSYHFLKLKIYTKKTQNTIWISINNIFKVHKSSKTQPNTSFFLRQLKQKPSLAFLCN